MEKMKKWILLSAIILIFTTIPFFLLQPENKGSMHLDLSNMFLDTNTGAILIIDELNTYEKVTIDNPVSEANYHSGDLVSFWYYEDDGLVDLGDISLRYANWTVPVVHGVKNVVIVPNLWLLL